MWGDFGLTMLRPNLSSPSARGERDVAPARRWEDPEGPQMPVTKSLGVMEKHVFLLGSAG